MHLPAVDPDPGTVVRAVHPRQVGARGEVGVVGHQVEAAGLEARLVVDVRHRPAGPPAVGLGDTELLIAEVLKEFKITKRIAPQIGPSGGCLSGTTETG